jgi:2-oxoglutarate ferredoxin oxidoreductase subunit alpha
VQEAIDLTVLAFDLAEKYRTIAVVLADGSIGQMMEPAELPPMMPLQRTVPNWAVTGEAGRERRQLSSIYLNPEDEEDTNMRLLERWLRIRNEEVRYKEYFLDDAEIVVVGFGTAGRVALSAVRTARAEGIKAGLFRPITLSPFPEHELKELANEAEALLVVEMNAGQMLDDVKLAVEGACPVEFYGRLGGVVPFPDEVLAEIRRLATGPIIDQNGYTRERWLERLAMVKGAK